MNPGSVFRRILYAVLAIIGLLVLTYAMPVLLQNVKPVQPEVPTPEPESTEPEQADIIIRPFKRIITDQGRTELEIHAVQAEINQEKKLFTLDTIEQIVFYGDDGREITVTADAGHWNQAKRSVYISGNVKCWIAQGEHDPVEITCDWISYDSEKRLIHGGEGVYLKSGPYDGEGESIYMDLAANTIRLQGNAITRIRPEALSDSPVAFDSVIEISADIITYNHAISVLMYDGNCRIVSGTNTIHGGQMTFDFASDQRLSIFNGVTMSISMIPDIAGPRKPVRVTAGEMNVEVEAGEIVIRRDVAAVFGDSRLTADEIQFQMDSESKDFIGGSARGNVFYQQGAVTARSGTALYNPIEGQLIFSDNASIARGDTDRIQADFIRLFIDRKFYIADGRVKIRFVPSGQSQQDLTPVPDGDSSGLPGMNVMKPVDMVCQRAEFDEITGRMILDGNVRGTQKDYTFSAGQITMFFNPEKNELSTMEAVGGVTLSEQDRVVTGGKLRYDVTKDEIEIWEKPTFWQGENQTRADRFIYRPNQGVLELIGNIDMVFEVRDAEIDDSLMESIDSGADNTGDAEASQIRITAQIGEYREKEHKANFSDTVTIDWKSWKIHSDAMEIEFEPSTGDISHAQADGNISVDHEMFKATGESLTYLPEQSIIILRGSDVEKCKIQQDVRGTQGDEITFYLEENRFIIEKGESIIMPSELTGSIE